LLVNAKLSKHVINVLWIFDEIEEYTPTLNFC